MLDSLPISGAKVKRSASSAPFLIEAARVTNPLVYVIDPIVVLTENLLQIPDDYIVLSLFLYFFGTFTKTFTFISG